MAKRKKPAQDPLLKTPTPPPGTPAWITKETTNLPNSTQSRQAHLNHCPQCGALILTGLDGDIAAMPTKTDITLLSWKQQNIAHATGRHLYALTKTDTAYQLNLIHEPNPYPWMNILPNHTCGNPLTGQSLLTPQQKEPENDNPPF